MLSPGLSEGQEKKPATKPSPQKASPAPKATPARETALNDATVQQLFKQGEELFKKDKPEEAIRIFLNIYRFSKDILTFLPVVQPQYEKLLKEGSLSQEEKEDVYIKQKRIQDLTNKYTALKIESAYYAGAIYAKRGDSEQARKYLLEVCQTAPFSLNPKATWFKSKNLLLTLFQLEGEF
jgi:tetratricopeptide (TPR) repeat protein